MGEVDGVVVGRTDEERRVLLLSESYAGYRQLVDHMREGAVTLLPTGEIAFANRAFGRMLGAEQDGICGSSLEQHTVPEHRERARSFLDGQAPATEATIHLRRRGGEPISAVARVVGVSPDFVTLLLSPADGYADEEAASTLHAIRSGAVDAFVVGEDRVVLLDAAQAPYRALVERMRQGAVTVQEDGQIVFVNARFVAMTGVHRRRLVGSKMIDWVDPKDRPAFERLLAAPENVQIEATLRSESGVALPFQVAATALDGSTLILFSDLTERRRHAAADESTRRFLGLLACEFTERLDSIREGLRILKGCNPDLHSTKAIASIELHAQRLEGVVENLRRVNPGE